MLIAGTTIGAGMLAMPLACAGVGFLITVLLLIVLWLLTSYSALLLVEAHQHMDTTRAGLSTLTHCYLGYYGYWVTHSTILLLLYALVAAYLTAGGSQLAITLNQLLNWHITPQQGVWLLMSIIATVVCYSTALVDASNRLLFSVKITTFLLMLSFMAPQVQQANLLTLPSSRGAILSAIPVMFTAFGFHGTLPSIVHYLEGDTWRLRRVVIGGSAIPLLLYLSWQWATQGMLEQTHFLGILADHSGLQGIMHAIHQAGVNPWIDWVVGLFADLALITSLLGVSIGLLDYWIDMAKLPATPRGRLQAGVVAFLPPITFALLYPQGFMVALGYAAIALAILALVLPAVLVWRVRQLYPAFPGYRVSGGPLALILVALCGLLIISIQLSISIGMVPTVIS